MRHFGFISSLYRSFYSKLFYYDVLKRWVGVGFLNLFLVTAVCWLPTLFFNHSAAIVSNFFHSIKSEAYQNISSKLFSANFSFTEKKKGERETVTRVVQKDNGKVTVTTTKTRIETAKGKPPIKTVTEKVTTTDLLPEKGKNSTKSLTFSHTSDEVPFFIRLILYVLGVVASFVYRIFQVFIYSLFAFLCLSAINVRLDYSAVLRVTSVAVIPAMVIAALTDLVSPAFFINPFFYLIISLLYVAYGILGNQAGLKRDAKE
jgi:hypothetical protein